MPGSRNGSQDSGFVRGVCRGTTRIAIASAALALVLSASFAHAQSRERHTPQILDVALGPDGTLKGKTLTGAQNAVQAYEKVEVTWEGRTVAATASDRDGVFEVRGLRSGVHVVSVGDRHQVCRFWADGEAPPHSVRGVAFVESAEAVVRAQSGAGFWGLAGGLRW